MHEQRFELSELGGYIIDNLTGKWYPCTGYNIVKLLNRENERANSVVESCDSIFKRYEFLIQNKTLEQMLRDAQDIAVENLKENIEYRKVMEKYNINSVEKLDQCLFNQRVWQFMFDLNLWWQGFFTAVGLYFVFLLGQIIGFNKKMQDKNKNFDEEW